MLRFESQIDVCLDNDIKILSGSFARRNFIKAFPEKPSVDMQQIKLSMKFDYPFLNACLEYIPIKDNLKDLFLALNRQVSSGLCNQRSLLSEAEKMTMGFYTAEQEADDLALEYLSLIGKSAEQYQNGLLKLAELGGDPGCQKWLKSQEGKPIPVLRNYSNAHHDLCFRWHEVKQEIQRHEYIEKK